MLHAQKIKFKKGVVTVDGEECLKYSTSLSNITISSLDESQTIYIKYIRTGVGESDGLFTKIIFVEQEKSFTSKSVIFTKKYLVKRLIQDNVIKECEFDKSKIDRFMMLYDEKIEENLIRH